MLIWRICKKRHAAAAFSGLGAQESGGRWNHKGDAVVYASATLSLACLEYFMHVEPIMAPDDLVAISAVLAPDASVEQWTAARLPSNWRQCPAPPRLAKLGSQWLRARRSLALIVPSAVIPSENNVLINPRHPQAALITQVKSRPFRFDERMWK